jgi:drug/metabolite transporter (DMT)-like permease
MRRYLYLFTMIAFISVISGCNPYNNAGEGAAAGGVLGAVAGGVIGHQSHNAAAGMLIGGAVGAASGAVIGSHIQKPEPPPQQVVVVQPAPVVVAQAPSVVYPQDSVTVNVPNDNGGYTAVMLKRSGNGYVGPQGEYYDAMPTTEQLSALYGR